MAKEMTTLEIRSANVDLVGTWHKADVEAEMVEVGLQPVNYDNWVWYILSHFDFPEHIIEALEDDNVLTMAFRFNGEVVYVTKK